MNPRSLLLSILVFVVLICNAFSATSLLEVLKSNTTAAVGFAYLSQSNKLVTFKPIDQLSSLKNGQLYVVFPVYLYKADASNPDSKTLKIKIYFTNGTVVQKDLSSEISGSDDANVVFKYSGNKTIRYFGIGNVYHTYKIAMYTIGLRVQDFPFMVNFSGNVKRIEIIVAIKKGSKTTINDINLTFENNLPLLKKFYKGTVNKVQFLGSVNITENSLSVSLPNLEFIKINNPELNNLVVIGGNTTESKFNMSGIILSPSIASFTRIGSSAYLMIEPNVIIDKSLKTIYGLGFIANCSETDGSGFYYVTMDYINDLNSMLCNPTYLSPTNVNISFNFVNIDKLVQHGNEKEAPIHIKKFVVVSPSICITNNWFAIVMAKTLLKSSPYLYFKYVSPAGLKDYSGVLSTGLDAYKSFIENDINGVGSGKSLMLNALKNFEKNRYGYLYSKIINIKPTYVIKHGDQCIMFFEYNYTLFGVKPSQVSVVLMNVNGTTKTEFKKALKLDNIVWLSDVKQGLTGIIEGLGTLNQYVYHVSVMPYPTSPSNNPLYVFKFSPTIKVTTYLFRESLVPIVLGTIGALSAIIGGTVITTQLLSWYERVINAETKSVASIATEMYDSLYYSISQELLTTGDPDLEALGFLLNARKTYALLFSSLEDSVTGRLYKFYNILEENENIRNKFFNALKDKLASDPEFANQFKKAFSDEVYNKIMSENYEAALDEMFNVNSNLDVAKLNVKNAITNYDDEKIVKEGLENVMEKLMNENPDIKDLLTEELRAPDFVMSDGFAMSNEITKVMGSSDLLENLNEEFASATTYSDYINNFVKRVVAKSLKYLYYTLSEGEVESGGGILKTIYYTLNSLKDSNPDAVQEFINGIKSLAETLESESNTIYDIAELADQCSIKNLMLDIAKKVSMDNLNDLKPLYKVLYSTARAINSGMERLLTGEEITDEAAQKIAQSSIDEGATFSDKLFELLRLRKITKITSAIEKIHETLTGLGAGKLFLSFMYIAGAVSWIAGAVETIGMYLNMIRFAQQVYSHSINNSSGYLPLVLVNFEGRSFPVPIPIDKSLIQPVKFDKVHMAFCNIPFVGTNIHTFGGLYVGNASTVTSINQYLPPVGLLPDFYSPNVLNDIIYKAETAALVASQGGMATANALALYQLARTGSVAAEAAAETVAETAVEEAAAETASILGLDFVSIVGGPIGIVASLIIMFGVMGYSCHNFKFAPYHQFIKLLGVNTFVIVNSLLEFKAKRLHIPIDPDRLVIQFYMNNSSYEKLLKQICIYGYLGKWNPTTHMCFAGALFNNTPYLAYVDNNTSFYYGPIPSKVLMDSGDVYVGIISLPMALSEKIDNHEYTYSNKEFFAILNGIWKYFQSPDANLNSFIGWLKGLPGLKKNYGLMAILAAYEKNRKDIMAYLIAGACLGSMVQDFGINNNQSIDRLVCEHFIDDCLPARYKTYYKNLSIIANKSEYAPLLSGNPTSPIVTTNNTKIEFSNNISVRAFNSTDYIVYAPLIVLYSRMTSKDQISTIKLTMETNPTYTIKFPVYKKSIKIYLDVIGQGPKGYFHSVASELYMDPSSPIPRTEFVNISVDGHNMTVLPVTIYNISKTSIYNFNFPLQYLYYICKSNDFNINVTKQMEYLVVGHNKYYGIFKTMFNTKDVLTDQGIPDYWPNESQSAPVIKPRPNFIKVVPTSIGQELFNILSTGLSYNCPYSNSYISAGAVSQCLASKLPDVVVNEMINKGKFGFSTNVLAYVDRHNNKIVLLAMKGIVGTNDQTFWKKWSQVEPENHFYKMEPVEKCSGVCWPTCIFCHKVFGPPSLGLTDKPYEFQGYFEVQVLVPKTELSEMLTYCSSKYKNCKIALIAIPS